MLQLTVNEQNTFSITKDDDHLVLNGTPADWDASQQPNGLISVLYNGKSYTAIIENTDRKNKEVTLRVNGQLYKTTIKAPMPGMVLKILVTAGQQINKGDGLVILEAMKMENILKATGTATVKAIRVNERTAVEKGAILIELE